MNILPNFIAAGTVPCSEENHVNAPYLRKSFCLPTVPLAAEIQICGLGFYELYINGTNITKGALAPYISNPDDFCCYDTYDLKSYLRAGENVIGILLGNGMQNPFGGFVWDFDKAKWRGVPRVALAFEAQTEKGTVAFGADTSFKTAPSPITFDEYRLGTFYDANLEQRGWSEPGFDDRAWENAISVERPRGELIPCKAEPIRVQAEVKPLRIFPDKNGYTYDFGMNIAGVCRLKIKGEKGQTIRLNHAEWMCDGSFDKTNIISDFSKIDFLNEHGQVDRYICKGEGVETFVPPFTYHGFQQVYVEGLKPEQATEDLLTCLIMNSDLKERGGFSCSDEILNTLQIYARRSDLSNFYYFPTDCPHREKNGWTGDISASCEHMLLNLTAENSLREWLRSMRKAQAENGALPGIVPTAGWGFEWGNGPLWDSACVYVPYYIYKYTGDKEVLVENADMIFRYLNYITTRRGENGLIAIGLGDWMQPRRPANQYTTPLAFTDTATIMDMCRKASFIFEKIGRPLQKTFSDTLYKQLRQCIREELVDLNTMTVEGATQTGQTIAIAFDIFEENEKERAFAVLEEMIARDHEFIDTGILGIRYIFHILGAYGRADLAYKMITRPEFPSYGYWLQCGATSLWEDFQSEDVKNGSKNHHYFGDISHWFIGDLAGIKINPTCNNVDEVEISPHFIDALSHAEGFFNTKHGKIESAWHRDGDSVMLTVSAPTQIVGKICLAEGYRFEDGTIEKILKSGVYKAIK